MATLNQRSDHVPIDHTTPLDLYARLVKEMRPAAISLIRTYRRALPAHLDAEDLVQEAAIVMHQCLEEAVNVDSPAGYLASLGRKVMYHYCLKAMQEPHHQDLDAPVSAEKSDLLLHEVVPDAPIRLEAARVGEEREEYAPLYQALNLLPQEQQMLLAQRFGLFTQPPHNQFELAQQTHTARTTLRLREQRVLTKLYFLLRDHYPQYATHALANREAGHDLWQRLSHAYGELVAQGQPISERALVQTTKVHWYDAQAFLQERADRAGRPLRFCASRPSRLTSRLRLEEAYARLLAQAVRISGNTLMREAHTTKERACAYLLEKEHCTSLTPDQQTHQRLVETYAALPNKDTLSGRALAQLAGVSAKTACKYLKSLRQEKEQSHATV